MYKHSFFLIGKCVKITSLFSDVLLLYKTGVAQVKLTGGKDVQLPQPGKAVSS